MHEESPEREILPSLLLWDQLIPMFSGPACRFASQMGFVPGRCLQGHRELGQISKKEQFIHLILQEDPQGESQPSPVSGLVPWQISSCCGSSFSASRKLWIKPVSQSPGNSTGSSTVLVILLFWGLQPSEFPGWKEEQDGTAPWNCSAEL